MTRLLLIVTLGLCLATGVARSDEAATGELIEQLQQIQQLQGQFEQRQFGAGSGELVATTRGNFRLLRPGYFAWEINEPDRQLIIADLEHLWHYDLDLETVTRRPVSGREELSPLQVLGGDTDILKQRFEVSGEGAGRYLLTPNSGNPGFRSLVLILSQGQLAGMEIRDNLDQRLVIEFSAVDAQTTLTLDDFRFVPPEGADLFYHDQ